MREGFYENRAEADAYIRQCVAGYEEVSPNNSLLVNYCFSSRSEQRLELLIERGKPWFGKWRWHPLLLDEDEEFDEQDREVLKYHFIPSRRIPLKGSALLREMRRGIKLAQRFGVEFHGVTAGYRQGEKVANPDISKLLGES
jgi:hypothetical protein